MQSRKMTARLQAASPKSRVLLRTSASAGHGFGTALSEIIEQDVDVYAFLFDTLGLEYKAHGTRPGRTTSEARPQPRVANCRGGRPSGVSTRGSRAAVPSNLGTARYPVHSAATARRK